MHSAHEHACASSLLRACVAGGENRELWRCIQRMCMHALARCCARPWWAARAAGGRRASKLLLTAAGPPHGPPHHVWLRSAFLVCSVLNRRRRSRQSCRPNRLRSKQSRQSSRCGPPAPPLCHPTPSRLPPSQARRSAPSPWPCTPVLAHPAALDSPSPPPCPLAHLARPALWAHMPPPIPLVLYCLAGACALPPSFPACLAPPKGRTCPSHFVSTRSLPCFWGAHTHTLRMPADSCQSLTLCKSNAGAPPGGAAGTPGGAAGPASGCCAGRRRQPAGSHAAASGAD